MKAGHADRIALQISNLLVASPAEKLGLSSVPRTRRLQLVGTGVVLLAALFVGGVGNSVFLLSLVGGVLVMLALARPIAALVALPWAAIYLPFNVRVSTDVSINVSVVIVPALVVVWLLRMLWARQFRLAASRLYLPILAFILAATLSWLLGNVYWDPQVPRPNNVILVQVGQWSVFVFSVLAVVLGINLVQNARTLGFIAISYLCAGLLAVVLYTVPATVSTAEKIVQLGSVDSAFWIWMNSFLLALLLFDKRLRLPVAAVLVLALIMLWRLALGNSGWMSGMVPMGVSTAVLLALRLRRRFFFLLPLLLLAAVLTFPTIYAGLGLGREIQISGGGRLNHIQVVMMFAVRRPWFGLGMAAYRHYSATVSDIVAALLYRGVEISSHNNYVDIFAQMGICGLIVFFWLALTLGVVLLRATRSRPSGVELSFANAAVAAFVGMLISGLLGDWFFPFVYNIGFKGMRTSVSAWLLLGVAAGLLARVRPSSPDTSPTASVKMASDT